MAKRLKRVLSAPSEPVKRRKVRATSAINPKAGIWYDRLHAAILAAKERGADLKSISKNAGLAGNYISQLMNTGRIPSVENFISIVDYLDLSFMWILEGYEITALDEQILSLVAKSDEDSKRLMLDVIQRFQVGQQFQPTPASSDEGIAKTKP